jgi:ribonuclease-3
MKSYLACEGVMADIAAGMSLQRFLLLGKGEESTGGRTKKSILADSFEALIGAVYCDGGLDAARRTVLGLFGGKISQVVESGEFYDYKTELQERTQLLKGTLPEYRVIGQEGQDHRRVFTVAVYLEGKKLATASGGRIKEAEALAAKKALEKISGQ